MTLTEAYDKVTEVFGDCHKAVYVSITSGSDIAWQIYLSKPEPTMSDKKSTLDKAIADMKEKLNIDSLSEDVEVS